MKNRKRILALGLAGACLTLAACGAPGAGSGAAPSSGTAEPSSAEAAAGQESASSEEIVSLRWVTVGASQPTNYDAWQEQINAYLGEKIGVNIDVEVIPWSDWQQRRNVEVSTGGNWDIMFTDSSNYLNDVRRGAFADLTDLVQTDAPELYKLIPEDYWRAVEIDGKIYSVPTYKDSSMSQYSVWDEKLAVEAGVDPGTVHDLKGMDEAVRKITEHTGEPSFIMYIGGSGWQTFMYDSFGSGVNTVGVRVDDKDAKVCYIFEQDDVMETLRTIRGWYEDGVVNSDAATAPEVAGYKPVNMAQGWSGAAKTAWGPAMGVDTAASKYGETVLSNATVQGSLNCISVNCEHPDKALELLQTVNTDSYVRDLFFYGVEGDNWDYLEDGRVHKNNAEWTMAGYTQGTFFTVSQTDEIDFNQWDEVRELNENALPSVILGFAFDPSKVEDQIANCSTVWEKYRSELLTGTADPELLVPQMKKELEDSGMNDIMEEAQSQIDAWRAAGN